jgi:hypothetical protein
MCVAIDGWSLPPRDLVPRRTRGPNHRSGGLNLRPHRDRGDVDVDVDVDEELQAGLGRERALAQSSLPLRLFAGLLGGLAGELVPAPLFVLVRVGPVLRKVSRAAN